MINHIIVSFLFFALLPEVSYGQNFFEQRYRGWLWFEENEKDSQEKSNNIPSTGVPTKEQMVQAKRENEAFKEELEDLRHMMVRYPSNLTYIRLYRTSVKNEGIWDIIKIRLENL